MKPMYVLAALMLPLLTIAQTEKNFTLQIRVAASRPNMRIYLAYQFEGRKILDSAIMENGFYRFTGSVDQLLSATLITDYDHIGAQALIKRSSKGEYLDAIKFYLHPGLICLTAQERIAEAVFIGSVINEDNQLLKSMLKDIDEQRSAISRQLRAANYVSKANDDSRVTASLSAKDTLEARNMTRQLDSLSAASRPIIRKFIDTHPASEIALAALQSYIGAFGNLDTAMAMFNRLSDKVRNSVTGKVYYQTLLNRGVLVAGASAPQFTQHNEQGNPIELASFKGKYVLLEFWASWCSPCRKANPELLRLYKDFSSRNFTILGISLDEADGKQAWLKAIKDDGLIWTQVSDLKHWDNVVAKLYGVHAIPDNFLINPDGIIVARGLDNEQLRKKLEVLLP